VSRREGEDPEVYRITSAVGSHSEDMQRRATRYLMSMGIRTLCVILCIVVPGPLRWVFAAGAIILPYIAVVAANAKGERRVRPAGPPTPMARPGLPTAETYEAQPYVHGDARPAAGVQVPGQTAGPVPGPVPGPAARPMPGRVPGARRAS
jgi:hypothetical protein